ncbi:hypothetical protein JTL65_33065, partial [Pseudomonas aeruginosa]|nr:hypothetical protein [Pseudomonas aeruginosa]
MLSLLLPVDAIRADLVELHQLEDHPANLLQEPSETLGGFLTDLAFSTGKRQQFPDCGNTERHVLSGMASRIALKRNGSDLLIGQNFVWDRGTLIA